MDGKQQSFVARRLGVSKQSVSRWNKLLTTHGLHRLQHEGGRPSLVDRQSLKEFIALLKRQYAHTGPTSPSSWSTAWVTDRIAEQFNVAYDPAHVWRLLRGFGHQWPRRGRRPKVQTESQRDESAGVMVTQTRRSGNKRKKGQKIMRSQTDRGLIAELARLCDQHRVADSARARYAAGTVTQQRQVVQAALRVRRDKALQRLVLRGAEAVWLEAELRQLRGTVQTLNEELSRKRHAVTFQLETLRRANLHLTREADALNAELHRVRGQHQPKGRRYQRPRKRQDFITKVIT